MAIALSNDDSIDDEIKDLLTCSLCSNILHDPRSLPCLHSFCKRCLGQYVESFRGDDKNVETFPCSKCRKKFTLKANQDVDEMPSICFVQNMLEINAIEQKAKSSATCSRCQEVATNHCATCKEFFCKRCSTSHDSWMRNHDLLSVEELGTPESHVKMKAKLYCAKHEGEMLKYYCKTCRELSCIDCVVSDHIQKPNHVCVAVSDAQWQKKSLQSRSEILDEKLTEGNQALKNICEVMKSLETNAKSAKDQIEEQKQKLSKNVVVKLDRRARKLNEEVDNFYDELRNELSKQYDEIKDYLDRVEASVALPRNLLKRGCIEEVLSLQKAIDANIELLENEQPEDMTPVNDGGIQYFPGDIDYKVADVIVNKLGHVEGDSHISAVLVNLNTSSSILKGEIACIKQLQKWLGKKCNWNLCYRASRDGWSAQDFHSRCDNKGPTVVLVKANNCIFGGYTDRNWLSGLIFPYKNSSSSFLFSLRNKDNLPFIADIKQGQEHNAISCRSNYGPTFGGGCDLLICSKPHVNQSSYCNLGKTYQLPQPYVFQSAAAKSLLAGQFQFITTEIEVFN
ncbi:E3 ubiquitin-protein ligase TRIM56-like [Dendronephthya gigantea]|uniref:E3 ubiquitin-protein ligase TRIM56-like n=1 Tax=Dendronephthya gigantea TaxID=151771 RepID=UPI00106D193D|nr:E3 ubiquitin-protein ligase TRIM56-like [Dendronephthya gigantea]